MAHHVEHAIALARAGKAEVDAGRVESGILAFVEALRLAPEAPGILHNLANALLSLGRVDDALEAAQRAHLAAPDLLPAQSNLLSILLYSPSIAPESVADAHRQWGRRYLDVERPPVPPGERIRIGYLSSCFRQNPEYFFVEPILRSHDRTRFEIYCYSSAKRTDSFTDHLRSLADHWRDLRDLSDAEVAELMRADALHVVADCSGHYADSKLTALALRPAPVLVSLPTYPATTGLPAVDFRITDTHSDPVGRAEHLYTEQLARLPDTFVCYTPWPEYPEVGPLPADRNGFITFGSFNRLDKLNSAVLEVWSRILHELPQARLLIHSTFHGHADPPEEHCRATMKLFRDRGIDPGRIEFAGARPLFDYFDVRNRVDIALDSFPFPGLTTSCDSLWMGTPVVTLAGESHLGRTGVTLAHAVGLSDWVARDADDYVRIAVRMSKTPARLREIKRELRDRMARSPLMDAKGYTCQLEKAYMEMLDSVR